MKTSYQLFIGGVWQFGIVGLNSARQTAIDLAVYQQKPVDIYKRVERSETSDEFVETVKPSVIGRLA